MASRFWVGGTGNWDASTTTNWSATTGGAGGETAPGTADTVTFDASSGGGTVTVTATQEVISITSGAHTGTLNTNGQTITTSGTFSISGSGIRTVTLGASTLNVAQWTATTTTNLTFNANTSTIEQTSSSNAPSVGNLTYNNFTFTLAGTSNPNFTTAGATFANFTITGLTSIFSEVRFTGDITVTGTLTLNGNSTTNRLIIRSSVRGTARTLTAAAVSITNADFQDITGAGAASWDLSAITGGSGNCGGNSMKALGDTAFTTAATQTATGTASFTWSTHGWTSRVPLPQDDVSIPNAFAGGRTVTADVPILGKSVTFSCSGSPTLSVTGASPRVLGSLDLTGIATLTISGLALNFGFEGRSAYTLTSAGLNIDRAIVLDAPGGTLKLLDNLAQGISTSRTFNLTSGTLDLNGKTITNFGIFSVGSLSATRAIVDTAGSGIIDLTLTTTTTVWTYSGTNFTTSNTWTIKISGSTTNIRTFAGGGATYSKLWFSNATNAGQLNLTGSNTFTDIRAGIEGNAQTILFTAATTTTVTTFTVNGAESNLITIGSVTAASHTLTKAGGGIITCGYLSISRSTVNPITTWYAGANSTDGGDNVRWIFTEPPPPTSNFKTAFRNPLRPRIFGPGLAR